MFADFYQLYELDALGVRWYYLEEISATISKLKGICSLDLGRNQVKQVFKELGRLPPLQHLDLHNNQLTDLPEKIANL